MGPMRRSVCMFISLYIQVLALAMQVVDHNRTAEICSLIYYATHTIGINVHFITSLILRDCES